MSRIGRIEREASAAACDCGGYADRVDCTPEELKKLNCDSLKTYECCARVFLCRLCKKRIELQADSPEMG